MDKETTHTSSPESPDYAGKPRAADSQSTQSGDFDVVIQPHKPSGSVYELAILHLYV